MHYPQNWEFRVDLHYFRVWMIMGSTVEISPPAPLLKIGYFNFLGQGQAAGCKLNNFVKVD